MLYTEELIKRLPAHAVPSPGRMEVMQDIENREEP